LSAGKAVGLEACSRLTLFATGYLFRAKMDNEHHGYNLQVGKSNDMLAALEWREGMDLRPEEVLQPEMACEPRAEQRLVGRGLKLREVRH
jgi:hypothetical protein